MHPLDTLANLMLFGRSRSQHRQLGSDWVRGYKRLAASDLEYFTLSLFRGTDDQGYGKVLPG